VRYAVSIVLAVLAVLVLGGTGTASAKGCGKGARHHGNPSVSQYVEKIPTACGSKGDRGSAAGPSSSSSLPSSVNRQLTASSQGQLLKKVSSSGRDGAPPRGAHRTRSFGLQPRQPSSGSALSASVSAVSGGGNGRLIALLVIMALVVVLVA